MRATWKSDRPRPVALSGSAPIRQEVYIDSGDAAVPRLRRCKLAMLCAMLHVEDAPYGRCIGQPVGRPTGEWQDGGLEESPLTV